jgi:hypothetical protein
MSTAITCPLRWVLESGWRPNPATSSERRSSRPPWSLICPTYGPPQAEPNGWRTRTCAPAISTLRISACGPGRSRSATERATVQGPAPGR